MYTNVSVCLSILTIEKVMTVVYNIIKGRLCLLQVQ